MDVHILEGGHALCGLAGPPRDWPLGERWTYRADGANATCPGCRRVLEGAARPPIARPTLRWRIECLGDPSFAALRAAAAREWHLFADCFAREDRVTSISDLVVRIFGDPPLVVFADPRRGPIASHAVDILRELPDDALIVRPFAPYVPGDGGRVYVPCAGDSLS